MDLEKEVTSGVLYLTQGYLEYANVVVTTRALPNLYDGLKPVNRRILVVLKDMKSKLKDILVKCARICGDTMGLYHPHGDSSIYDALVLMTDTNGSLAFPLLYGNGNFGGYYKTDSAAHMRYTEARLHSNAEEYFGAMNGIDMIPNFDASMSEPEVLPVSFPAILVNSTSGIAVGFKSNIPSFNFSDVCDLVIEYLETGDCQTLIYPDFVSGGYYVRDDREILKLMRTGAARLKLRGRYIDSGKQIQVTEIPARKTLQGIVKQIRDIDVPSIVSAYDADDFDHGLLFVVNCASKARVNEALMTMYESTDFQCNYNADITVIQDGVPRRLGVWQVIKEWTEWRKGVLCKEYSFQLKEWEAKVREATAFMNVVNNYDKRMKLIEIVGSEGKKAGERFVSENFTRDEVPEDLIKFVSGRQLSDYYDGGRYATDFSTGRGHIDALQRSIAGVGDVIKAEMERLKSTYGERLKRKTEVTDVDYAFGSTHTRARSKEMPSSSVYYIFKDGFLRKLKSEFTDTSAQYSFYGMSDDILIAFDNRGRLLRVYCSDLPLNGYSELGTYLPKQYFGLSEQDGYRITWIGRMTGQTLMLLYKDGNVGFVDTGEWSSSTRNVRILEKGISGDCADKLGVVFNEDEIPEVLFVTDTDGRVAWVLTSTLRRKGRTAKTRAFYVSKSAELDTYCGKTMVASTVFFNHLDNYCRKLVYPDYTDFRGEVSEFIDMPI